jgi:hypothetical protein
MTIKSIKGTLAPMNALAVTKQTASKINKAVSVSGLSGVFKVSPAWHHGIIVTNASRPENDLTKFEFMSRLRELIHADGIEGLALEGMLTMKVDTTSNEFRVHVEAGNIVSEEVKFSHLSNPEKSPLNHILRMKEGQLMSVLVTEGFVK